MATSPPLTPGTFLKVTDHFTGAGKMVSTCSGATIGSFAGVIDCLDTDPGSTLRHPDVDRDLLSQLGIRNSEF